MISVLIVTYNSQKWIGRCLKSVRQHGAGCVGEVIVVDNASNDGTSQQVRRFPDVKLIASACNLGFAGGMNLAAKNSTGSALLILNPDTKLRTPLAPLQDLLERDTNTVATAPRLVDANGAFQRGFAIRRLPSRLSLIFEILLINRLWPRTA